jgi:transposase-like protein
MNMSNKQFELYADADKARDHLESILWPNGPICPHCEFKEAYKLEPKAGSKARKGLYKCKSCRKQFTVTVGTIFADSHIPLNHWVHAVDLICASKKGISSHQIHRTLGITYKSAWFMTHRIRYAMKSGPLASLLKGTVEADETYIGPKKVKGPRGRGAKNKTPVFALVQRNGDVRSVPVEKVTAKNLKEIIRQNVSKGARIMTDEFSSYRGLAKEFKAHETVNHGSGEYVRGKVHTNTAEGFFSLLKRGINGTFHHVSKRHLHRYLDEFNFRYNARKVDDRTRSAMALDSVSGKRLMYRDVS